MAVTGAGNTAESMGVDGAGCHPPQPRHRRRWVNPERKRELSVVFGQRLAEWRAASEVSQWELARRLQLDPSLVSRWESGARTPSTLQLVNLSHLTGMRLDWMLGQTDKPQTLEEWRAVAAAAAENAGPR